MDLNPISQPNNSLSDCLNGTIITYDGNEFNLQNDFGNYSLKNCSLQQGFVPVGMKSYGDIIYIASCSKDGKLCELGTYPSPKYPNLDELDYNIDNQAYAENLELENNYKPLWNYSVNGTRQNFTTGLLNFDLDHPVNIEIQPSYDGSVNLILNDDKNEPRLINSGFSIYENRKVRLVKRNQKEATNLYLEEKFKNQIRLKKVVEKIPRFELLDVPSTGQLKGGNYTFYLKMADSDYNKSDIVAESGQVSIFKGNSTSINSIHGTLLNETTDKAIQLRIDNIDTSFSNFYILYSREFSDLNGVRQYETFELTKPFEINEKELIDINEEKCFTIQIDGTEAVTQISEEELNIEYIPVDAVKTQAQQQNMLFIGNIKSDNLIYKELQEIAYKIKVTLKQNTNGIGWVNASYNTVTTGSEYYNPKNIYNYLGYWPEEYYRFGIVFIRDDDTITPAFNLLGKEFSNVEDSNESGFLIDEKTWENSSNDNYILKENSYYNRNGVFKNPLQGNNKIQNYDSQNVYPWYYTFEFPTLNKLPERIKGYFYVRQKRVPTILCQGMSISIDKTSHTPMLYDPNFDPQQPSAEFPRICNGEMFLIGDNTSDGEIEYKKASSQDKYFTESFLANFQDKFLYDDPFKNKTNEANWHMYLVSDGRSPIKFEKGDKKYTALGDHIVRTNKEHKQCSAILSLDACVIPELQSQLNGEKRVLVPQDQLNFHASLTSEKDSTVTKWTAQQINDSLNSLETWVKQVHIYLWSLNVIADTQFNNPFDGNVFGKKVPFMIDGAITIDPDKWMSAYDDESKLTGIDNKEYLIPIISIDRWYTVCDEIRNFINYGKVEATPENPDSGTGSDNPGTDTTTKPTTKSVDSEEYEGILFLINETQGNYYRAKRDEIIFQLQLYNIDQNNESGTGYLHGNVDYDGLPSYFTRAFQYDSLVEKPINAKQTENKVIFINSGNAAKSITHPSNQEKNLVFTTQAGDPADVSKVAIFGEGDEYRDKVYGAQFKWALRGIYCPLLGIDDVGDDSNPFLIDNTIYNIYTDGYNPTNKTNKEQWFTARSIDNSPYYAVSDRYSLKNSTLNVYRGDCFTNTVSIRINRNFIDPEVPITNEVLQYSSWAEHTFDGFNKTTKEDYAKVNRADVNAVSLGMWVTFKCMSNYNLGIRSENRQHTDEMALLGNPRSFFPLAGISAECGQKIEESWLLNSGYNATVGRKTNLLNQKLPYQKTDYSNRVMFSNIAVKDSFSNGYRVFQGASYRDIDNQYGEITKLLPWGNNLFCVFEHGCAIIPVNEKALMQTTTEQTIHIYGYGVLPDQLSIISQDFGSIWADSIIRTPLGIYGVDSSAKKIWRYTDSKGFETISDMVVQRFLNDNLLVTESDKYTNVLIRNIKTHYNAYKGDVMFTFIKDDFTWNICYNERQGMWITKYSWMPVYSENINNQFYSFSLDQSKEGDAKLYLHGRTGVFDEIDYTDNNPTNQLKPTKWYDKQEPFEFEFVVTQDTGLHKIFDNLILVSNNVQPESIQFSLIGDSYLFNKARLYHDSENNPINIYKNTDDGFNKENLRGTIANPYTPIETPYLKNTKIQYDPILDQYELVMEQQTKNMETFGRRLGNIHYKEDAWYLVFDPIVFDENINSQSVEQTNPKWKTVPLKDKWLKIRIKYRGDQLAIITALNTIYRLTSS